MIVGVGGKGREEGGTWSGRSPASV
jgi:hypothetical protein